MMQYFICRVYTSVNSHVRKVYYIDSSSSLKVKTFAIESLVGANNTTVVFVDKGGDNHRLPSRSKYSFYSIQYKSSVNTE